MWHCFQFDSFKWSQQKAIRDHDWSKPLCCWWWFSHGRTLELTIGKWKLMGIFLLDLMMLMKLAQVPPSLFPMMSTYQKGWPTFGENFPPCNEGQQSRINGASVQSGISTWRSWIATWHPVAKWTSQQSGMATQILDFSSRPPPISLSP